MRQGSDPRQACRSALRNACLLSAKSNPRKMTSSSRRMPGVWLLPPLLFLGLALTWAQTPPPSAAAKWYKGNLHTHSLWSDGDDYPEMIADWYKQHGYNFLALSDHNVMQEGQRWFEIKAPGVVAGEIVQRGGGDALKKYVARFGNDWVEQRHVDGKHEVRLKPLPEYRSLL